MTAMIRRSAEIDTSTPAVVLKLDANVMHHGGLGVIRSLGRLGVPVYGVHEDALAPAAHSRYLHGRWFWRPDTANPADVTEGLHRLAERIGRKSVLLPTDDAGAIFLAEQGESLREWFHFPVIDRDLPRRVAGKYSLYELCQQLDVACPDAVMPSSWQQCEDFTDATGFPVIAKMTTPWRAAMRSTAIVRSRQELAVVYRKCELSGSGLLLQEFIPGGLGRDWFFHAYCDRFSRCRPGCTGVKHRSYPAHAGLTSLGQWVDNAELDNQAQQLLSKLAFRGIVDLDFRWDARDGRFKLLDFNPRLGAQFRLFTDQAGLDVAVAAYLDLTGQEIPETVPHRQRTYLVENYDPIGALRYWRGGELALWQWIASLRGVDETAWFARDDLLPFGLMCVRMGWRGVSRRFTRTGDGMPKPPLYRQGRGAITRAGHEVATATSTHRGLRT